MKRFLNFFLVSLTALFTNIFALPWSGLWLDHRYRLVWRLPFWIETVAAIFILLDMVIALRYCWMCAFDSFGKSSSTEAWSCITPFQREGPLRAFSTLQDMSAYEDQVSMTLVYLKKVR